MRRIVVLLVPVLLLGACGNVLAPPAARVGERAISATDVTAALNRFEKTSQFAQAAQQSSKNAVARQFEQSYLARIIRRYVLTARARQLDVVVSRADVQKAISQIQSSFPSRQAFDKALAQQGLTLNELGPLVRDRVLEQKLREKVTADVAPTDQELRSYYQQHLLEYRQLLVSHILVSSRSQAQRVVDRLHRAKPAQVPSVFSRLAKSLSTDKGSAVKGGELGPLTPGSNSFVPPFQKAAEALKPGEVSEPVHSKFGWHVIFVRNHVQSFDQARAQITQQVGGPRQSEQWQTWLMAAYKEAHVNVNPRYGNLDLKTQTIVDSPGNFPGSAASPSVPRSSPSG